MSVLAVTIFLKVSVIISGGTVSIYTRAGSICTCKKKQTALVTPISVDCIVDRGIYFFTATVIYKFVEFFLS